MDEISFLVLFSDFDEIYEIRRDKKVKEEDKDDNERLFISSGDGDQYIT